MGKYVVSADEYYYIHKVVLLCNEFYDDLIATRHEDVNKEDFNNLAGHLVAYSELHGISHEGLCNVLKDIKGIQYEDVINILNLWRNSIEHTLLALDVVIRGDVMTEEYIDLKYYKTNDSQKETSNQWDMC